VDTAHRPDGQPTYAAQENLEVVTGGVGPVSAAVTHPDIEELLPWFVPHEARYVPCAALREEYPEDTGYASLSSFVSEMQPDGGGGGPEGSTPEGGEGVLEGGAGAGGGVLQEAAAATAVVVDRSDAPGSGSQPEPAAK
jgi:hypothetical protein